ncbi:Transcriptional activator protein LasR [Burkholderia cepacia]|nr:Transcriptional activator protein LasR [Burkholderia cepacia]
MLRHCFRSALPLVWDDALFALPEQRPCYEAAAAYGMRSGVVLPVRGAKGEVGMLLCASTDELAATREHCDRHLAALTLLRDVACEAIAGTRCHAPPDSVPRLSRREVECLRWHAAGKTSWEIGHILNVTESCIHEHPPQVQRVTSARSRAARGRVGADQHLRRDRADLMRARRRASGRETR